MRRLLYFVILLALVFAPLNRVEIAQLLPIEAVAVYMDGEEVVLETDTAHTGKGATVSQALESLKKNTPKVVYLDTARYLLVAKNAVGQVDSLRQFLKPSVRVCVCEAEGMVKEALEYVEIHQKPPKLRDWTGVNYSA